MNSALLPAQLMCDQSPAPMGRLARGEALHIYRWMRAARCVDEIERELVARGEAFFHVGAAGHEASAALALLLLPQDYLHCHYRDKALMLARGMPVAEFFDSLLCNGAGHSAGRQMSAHLSAPALNILSLVGPVGNNALQAAGVAQQIKDQLSRPVVLCSLGDGTTQQGEVLEAIAEAVRSTLPVLFLIQDNHYSISTPTEGRTFFSQPGGEASSYYGLAIHRVDGRNAMVCLAALRALVDEMRATRGPVLCVLAVERLTSHTNGDDDSYRDPAGVQKLRETSDPLKNLRLALAGDGVELRALDALDTEIGAEVRAAAECALERPAPVAQHAAKAALACALISRTLEQRGSGQGEAVTMAQALCATLHARMAADPRVTLYGEDIADPKGDVFGVTRGLSLAFPGRVRNSPLSEATIIGTSIGRALAGGRPVAFLQFADFLPLAFNQIATELATMEWRTQGGWQAPVIVMVACGGYRPGLGPFHAQTFESVTAHVPGLDVAMPATASDAAGMLNAAFRSERPTVLFYPKALLNDRTRTTSADVARQFVPVGVSRLVRHGDDLTIVAWGNTVPICEAVAARLEGAGFGTEVIDLRWLSPWDREAVCASARKTRRLLVVHEDNISSGFGAEVVATVAESVTGAIQLRRLARPDTFVPCNFPNQLELLPSYRSTLTTASEMLGLDLVWESPIATNPTGRRVVNAIGSGPSDQTVEVVEMRVEVGQRVKAGEILASLEADKAIFDIAAPADGLVEAIHLQVGAAAPVDAPLLTLVVARAREPQLLAERIGVARLSRRATAPHPNEAARTLQTVVLTGLGVARGTAHLDNAELALRLPAAGSAADILDLTGIETRLVAGEDQDAVSMATDAARLALQDAGVPAAALALVICSTCTPTMIAPSTACRVLQRLAPELDSVPAYDLHAACSGYLYGLASAWDFLQCHPDSHVLLITTETMRRVVDIDDPDTSPIFGDAATATILSNTPLRGPGLATLHRPVLGAHGENGDCLRVPLPTPGRFVHMNGRRVFAEAIRRMSAMLALACARSNLALSDLDLVVPHQANGRIIEAMRARLKLPSERVWNGIRFTGNTSSSSIPLALDTALRQAHGGARIGLTAFGAGRTYGGAILEKRGP